MKTALTLGLVALTATAATAQSFTYSGSVRLRQEGWDWFKPATGNYQNAYTFTALVLRSAAIRNTPKDNVTFEVEAPLLLGLPTRATAPAPQGGLGLGANYRSFNGTQTNSLWVKQAYYLDKREGIRLGRFEFSDGGEVTPKNPVLAAVKKQRIAERLIGPFGWTHIGRSFDGVHYSKTDGRGQNVTLVGAYPTQGVFELNAQGTLTAVRFGYLAGTRTSATQDQRLFAAIYEDARKGVTKVDNRASAAGDTDPIRITTVGGHWLRTGSTGAGKWDALAWGALQTGDWGKLSHRAYAYAAELGLTPQTTPASLSYRVGYNVYSGDSDGTDTRHRTFYPMLNTPRIYARTPFYAEANLRDTFVSVQAKPQAQTTVRADYHLLSLDRATDRWYAAGGPFVSSGNFGLIGRGNPSGKTRLGDLLDVSIDRTINPRTTATLYVGQMIGKSVVQAIYPDKSGLLVYGEVNYKF